MRGSTWGQEWRKWFVSLTRMYSAKTGLFGPPRFKLNPKLYNIEKFYFYFLLTCFPFFLFWGKTQLFLIAIKESWSDWTTSQGQHVNSVGPIRFKNITIAVLFHFQKRFFSKNLRIFWIPFSNILTSCLNLKINVKLLKINKIMIKSTRRSIVWYIHTWSISGKNLIF